MPSKRPQGGKTGRGTSGKSERTGKNEKSFSGRGGKKDFTNTDKKRGGFKKEGKSFDKGSKTAGRSKGFDKDKSFDRDKTYTKDKKPFDRERSYGKEKSFDRDKSYSRDKKPFDREKSYGKDRSFDRDKSYGKEKKSFDRDKKPFDRDKKPFGKSRDFEPGQKSTGVKRSYTKKESFDNETYSSSWDEDRKPAKTRDSKKTGGFKDGGKKTPFGKQPVSGKKPRQRDEDIYEEADALENAADYTEKKKSFDKKKTEYEKLIKRSEKNFGRAEKKDDGTIRLNKYLANSGVASRRDADRLIESGAVTVNGVVVTQLGTKIKTTDRVHYGGQSVKTEKLVYILLNKPKDYITTMDDPQGRKTVMSLIRGAAKERVYPVGRLDRNTTGVLLFTNDGELTRRLTHPKFLVSKMYHVTLDKNFGKDDLEQMRKGLELEDGYIKPDQLEYAGESKKELGIEIHSGRNRIVRRMFEHLGYDVVKLDRVQFAGLNKKDTPRGKWRFLSEKEVGFLKML